MRIENQMLPKVGRYTFALVSIVVGYVTGVLNAFVYVLTTGTQFTLFDIFSGWGVIIGGAGFCGFLGG